MISLGSHDSDWRFVDADGSAIETVTALGDIPSDVVPGEFLMYPDTQNVLRWYIVCDKARSWDGKRWKVSGTLSLFDPGTMTESQLYDHRRKMLKWGGWIDR